MKLVFAIILLVHPGGAIKYGETIEDE